MSKARKSAGQLVRYGLVGIVSNLVVYFTSPERISASFLTLTGPKHYLKRMYSTGDLVREENGRLYFIGRKDNQIKHMGYRIELEEIEHALMRLPQVNQAAVIYHREPAPPIES